MTTNSNLSEVAKLRISPDPAIRSERMAELARKRHASLTPEERKNHALRMVKARELKKAKLSY